MEPNQIPPAPVKEVIATPSKTHQFLLGFLVLVITASVVFSAMLLIKPKLLEETIPVTDQYAGWKTYTNTKYGFELQYPADWKIEQENELMCEDSGCAGENAVTISPSKPGVWVEIDDYGGDAHDWKSTIYGLYSIKNKVIHKNNLYLDVEIFDDTPDKENYMKELDQILSTFKLIEPTATSIVDTTNWKTYTNSQYGFELKYPQDWDYRISTTTNIDLLLSIGFDTIKHFTGPPCQCDMGIYITLNIYKDLHAYLGNSGFSNFNEWIKIPGVISWLEKTPRQTVVDGITWYCGAQEGPGVREACVTQINGHIFRTYLYYNDGVDTDKEPLTSERILSTFKFIEATATTTVDTTNWKTYKNSQYGFEFKYPADWVIGNQTGQIQGPGKSIISLYINGLTQKPGDLDFHDGVNLIFGISQNNFNAVQKYVLYPQGYATGTTFSNFGFQGSEANTGNSDELISAYYTLDNHTYLIMDWERASGFTEKPNDLTYQKYLIPILSTFKLTK